MKQLICLLLIIQPIVLNAQLDSFPTYTDNPIWGYYSQGGHLTSPVFTMYGLLGDTLINTENYSKIYSLSDTILEESSIENFYGGLRVSEEKVYYFNIFTSKEEILYDFSLSINDTVIFNDLGDYGVVYDIDSILVNGTIHKRFYLENANYGSGEWIENIGSIHGLLVSMTYPSENNPPITNLVCFKYQDLNYFPNYNCSCFNNYLVSTSIIEKKTNENNITIYPNPINEKSTVKTKTNDLIAYCYIYDINGSLIKYCDINSNIFNIGKENLKSGIYVISAIMQNGNSYSIKFTKP